VKPVDELDALSAEMTALLAEPEVSPSKRADLIARLLALQMRHRRRWVVEYAVWLGVDIVIGVTYAWLAAKSSGGFRLFYLVFILMEAAILTRSIFNALQVWQSMKICIINSRLLLATLLSAVPDEVKPPN
jgi:hypothetical protein